MRLQTCIIFLIDVYSSSNKSFDERQISLLAGEVQVSLTTPVPLLKISRQEFGSF